MHGVPGTLQFYSLASKRKCVIAMYLILNKLARLFQCPVDVLLIIRCLQFMTITQLKYPPMLKLRPCN